MSAARKMRRDSPPVRKVAQGPAIERGPRSYLRPVIETMARIKRDRGHGVFVFVAPDSGAGTTTVVGLLAQDLVREMACTVAVVPTETLNEADPSRLPQGYVESTPNVWVAVADRDLERLPDEALEHVWLSATERSFDFVLVDCPSLAAGSQALRVNESADGSFLVVEAGKTKTEQIEQSQQLLRSGGRLKGAILNRRTYAIPRFLYKLL